MTHLRDAPATLSMDDLDEAHGGIAIHSLGTYLPQQGTTTNIGLTQPTYTGFGQQPLYPGYGGYGLTTPSFLQPGYVQPALQPTTYLQPGYGPGYGQSFYGPEPIIIEQYYEEPRQNDTAAIVGAVAGFLGGFF